MSVDRHDKRVDRICDGIAELARAESMRPVDLLELIVSRFGERLEHPLEQDQLLAAAEELGIDLCPSARPGCEEAGL